MVEENGKVSYETPAGRLSLPLSIVARVERDAQGAGGPDSENPAANFSIAPPQGLSGASYDEVARAAVHGGSIDRAYIARLESAAQDGAAGAVERVLAAHAAAAQFELSRGDLDQAIGQYRRALVFAPQNGDLLLNVAYLHLRRSEYAPALDFLARAERVETDSPDVAKLKGWAYYGLNRLDLAAAEWKRALRLRPDDEVQQALEKAQRDLQAESNYREGESSHFTLRYYGGAAPQLTRQVLRTLEDDFGEISSQLGYTPPAPIGVILYTDRAFADITRAPGWVGALNDGRIRVPVQGLTSMTDGLASVLEHELTHSFIQQKTGGRCPVWLQEGVAQWMEGKRSGESAAFLVDTYERHEDLRLDSLEGSWMNLPGGLASYAYAWSLALVESMISNGGMGDVSRLLDRISTEPSTEAALRAALHVDYAALAQSTVDYLRRTYLH